MIDMFQDVFEVLAEGLNRSVVDDFLVYLALAYGWPKSRNLVYA